MRFIFLLLILTTCSVLAQLDKASYYSFGEQIYLEAVPVENINQDSIKVLLISKVVYDAMTFEKQNNIDPNSRYFARPTFEFVIKDKDGVIRKRFEVVDTVYAGKYEQTDSKKDFYSFTKFINIQKGNYTVSINLMNKSSRNKIYKLVNLNTTKFSPIFCKSTNYGSMNEIEPLAYGSSMPFSSSSVRVMIPILTKSFSKSTNYIIVKQKKDEDEEYEQEFVKLSGNVDYRNSYSINTFAYNGKSYISLRKSDSAYNFLDIELSSNKILPGNYTLKIYDDNSRDTLSFDFKNEWFDKPLSLKKVGYAIDCMSYILQDNELEDMKSGDVTENWTKFYTFWKKKDPTQNSLYNEALIQYFTRVDYAFFNFQTLSETDGYKTDRGKIYILFGEPQKITNSFENGKSLIYWAYPKLKKEYVFELISSGVYKLINIVEKK